MRRSPAWALFLALLSGAASARAQPARPARPGDEDKALAATLFDEGHALLSQGEVPAACRKLEESQRLDPLPGTILNLAACHEREGLTASAMAEFREARALAERDHRGDRVAYADEHLRSIERRLSRLLIVVPPSADLHDLTITRDGVAIGRAAWGERIPVNPGAHVIEATAPHKQSLRVEVSVGPDADVQTVTIPALQDAPVGAPPRVLASPVTASAAPPSLEHPAPERERGLSKRRQWALVAAGTGVAGIVTGSVAGLGAIAKHDAPGAVCTGTPCPAAVGLNGEAGFAADVSTASFAVGLVGLGLGAFLWFGDTGVGVLPGVGTVHVGGRF
jgi:hypothetical protein